MRMAALSTTFEPALLKRVNNFSFRGCIRRPMGDPRGPTVRRTRRASRGGGPSTPDDKGKGVPTPFHYQLIAHREGCGKTRVVPQNPRPRPEPAEMGVAKCVCCCRRRVARGRDERLRGEWPVMDANVIIVGAGPDWPDAGG
jgi:hypothetical protein